MSKIVNPEMIILARDIRGVTQTQLAKLSNIHQGSVSRYEGGLFEVPEEDLAKFAKHLGFPIDFFYLNTQRQGADTSRIFHRMRRTTSVKDQKRIDSLMDVYRYGSDILLEAIDYEFPYDIPQFNVKHFRNISEVAAAVRAHWNIPQSGPINNLLAQLEAASSLVFRYDFGTDKVDEAVQWDKPKPAIIMINSRAPSDRIRFSLAHALGHLVMHHHIAPHDNIEREADEFASAFLMPADDIIEYLIPVTIDHMLELKPFWKVSMQALIYRAKDLDVITERRYTSLFTMLSKMGYRKKEPNPLPIEIPKLVHEILQIYIDKLGYSEEELATLLRLSVDDFRQWYYPDKQTPSNVIKLPKYKPA